MVASLLDGGLTVAEAGQLTPWQITHLYGHKRDRHGQLRPEFRGAGQESYEEQFRGLWRGRGLPEYLIERKWRAWLTSSQS